MRETAVGATAESRQGTRVSRGARLRVLGIVVAVLTVALVGTLAWRGLTDYRALQTALESSQRILVDLERLGSAFKDAEAGQRGYAITGNDAFLDPYEAAQTAIPQILVQLRDNLIDNAAQLRRLHELENVGAEKLRVVTLGVEQRRRDGVVADETRLNHGRALMDRIRAIIATMSIEERRVYEERVAEVNADTNVIIVIAVISTLASLSLILAGFVTTGREVRRRVAAEGALRDTNRQLEQRFAEQSTHLEREAAERRRLGNSFEAIVEHAPFSLIGLDLEGRVFLWNHTAEQTFGYTSAEVIGKPYPLTGPGKEGEFRQVLQRTVEGHVLRNAPFRRLHKDGRPVDILSSSAALRDPQGRIYAVIFAVQNVTDRLLLEKQLQQAQRMEAVGQLTGGIAHDFNNLLGVVVGNLDLVIETTKDEQTRELADAALKGALRGSDLVQRLLAFARKQPLEPKVIDLNDRLPSMKALLQRTIGANITVRTAAAGDLWLVLADPAQVEDALMNLAINARDAMPKGGTLTIETANVVLDAAYAAQHADVKPGDYVMIAVSDTGTGIAADVLDRVFEPFFTTKATGKGTGLGLSMVYGFARQSGGHAKIYSEIGHGTTVKLYLPRALDQGEADDAPAAAAPASIVPTGGETILLVEDDEAVRQTATRLLKGLGYRVHTAASGPAALELLRADEIRFDLLFTDVVMPEGMSGFDLLAEVHRRYPGMRVLLTSGYATEALRNTRPADATDVQILGKPYRREELARAIRRALEG